MVAFNEVPAAIRTPFLFAEFDNTSAQQGPNQQPYRALMFGPTLSAGTAPDGSLTLISSSGAEAKALYGDGSLLASMVEAFRKANSFNELWVVNVPDDGGAVAAAGSYEFFNTCHS